MLFDTNYIKTKLNLFDKQITNIWLNEMIELLNIDCFEEKGYLCFSTKTQYIEQITIMKELIINKLNIEFVK